MLVKYFWIDRQFNEHGCYQCDMQDFRSWLSRITTNSFMYIVVQIKELLAVNYYHGIPDDNTGKVDWQLLKGERAIQFFNRKFNCSVTH